MFNITFTENLKQVIKDSWNDDEEMFIYNYQNIYYKRTGERISYSRIQRTIYNFANENKLSNFNLNILFEVINQLGLTIRLLYPPLERPYQLKLNQTVRELCYDSDPKIYEENIETLNQFLLVFLNQSSKA